jgi:hypothetical protein
MQLIIHLWFPRLAFRAVASRNREPVSPDRGINQELMTRDAAATTHRRDRRYDFWESFLIIPWLVNFNHPCPPQL